MGGKSGFSFHIKRSSHVLADAFRAGTLRRDDTEGAMDIVKRSVPGTSRLQESALRFCVDTSLKRARNMVPELGDDAEPPPTQSVPAALPEDQPVSLANSNDLLPSIRPRTPMSQPNTMRKRRRLSKAPIDGFQPSQSFLVRRPVQRLSNIGGVSAIIESVKELVEWPLIHRRLYQHLGVDPPRGILLHGPPGCGKTLLAHAVAGELGVSFLRVSGPEIVSGMSGESERNLRGLFEEAKRKQPSIIFLDEIDAIASKREGASKEMERRIVSQLLSCIDNLGVPTELTDDKSGALEEQPLLSDGGSATPKPRTPEDTTRVSAPCVVILAATNRADALEPALRRAGRFDREIELGAPDEDARKAILEKLCARLTLEQDLNFEMLAKRTAGYVGADLQLLIKEAGLSCVRRFVRMREQQKEEKEIDVEMSDGTDLSKGGSGEAADQLIADKVDEQNGASVGIPGTGPAVERDLFGDELFTSHELQECSIQMSDFEVALDTVQPSALREGFATRPNVSWDNIGSLEAVREEMMMAIVEPIRRPEMFSLLGLHAPAGVLLYGPPGCGKTLLARAVASESGANFISVKGPELLSKYVGDSELAVRKVFARAQSSAPCVIFFDELDALAPRRGSGNSSGASERVVNMLLTEMDGFNDRKKVFLIAATNRPDIIDPAMLRPGRLDKLIHVPLPDQAGRASILHKLLRGVKVAGDVNIEQVAGNEGSEGFSGADLQALIRAAGENALREKMKQKPNDFECDPSIQIEVRHFDEALKSVLPSVSMQDAKVYRSMKGQLRRTRATLKKDNG